MLNLQHLTYVHPNGDALLNDISLTVGRHDKIALVGNNGAGKSTLLQLMAGRLRPSAGTVRADVRTYYVPQVSGRSGGCTVAEALQIDGRLRALHSILNGDVTEASLELLGDDWGIEERCSEALAHWKLEGLDLARSMGSLSGGQKTRVFLAGIRIHRAGLVLLDEPSNHLDADGRSLLYDYVRETTDGLVVVSHDRALLDLLPAVCALSRGRIALYGGSYAFYEAQQALAANALEEDLKGREKALRKARETEREAIERQQKQDARGRRKQDQAGLPTILKHTLQHKAEKSTAKMKDVHAEKVGGLEQEVSRLRRELPDKDRMKLGFDDSALHKGKELIIAREINFGYGGHLLWPQPLSFTISSGQRIAVGSPNGSGKTTLIRLILGGLEPVHGTLQRAPMQAVYLDQDYSLIGNELTVYQQAQQYNTSYLEEHAVKSRLTHFLFLKDDWDKPCAALSGGERMRLMLCCLTIGGQAPDLIVLDEPTNNLDMQNTEILTDALSDYRGTVVVISHDAHFLEQIGADTVLTLAAGS